MTPLSPNELRDLRRASQRLKARITIGRAGLSDAIVAQVRQSLAQTPLLKVRVGGHERDAIDDVGRRLAEQVPCVLVARIGFVLTLYRPGDSDF
jgi:RNA-binding protein